MPDWMQSMSQTFEYYKVDPGTWRDAKRLDNITASSITRDADAETLGSASFDVVGEMKECYVRTYLVIRQNGITERFPLGTHLVSSPSSTFDGKLTNVTADAYTPLIELKDAIPPLGYSILKESNVMKEAYMICREKIRAPIVQTTCEEKLYSDFVANTNDTWISFISDLVYKAKYKLGLDEKGRVIFLPRQDLAALQPVWTYNDNNSSILYPEITCDHDLYGIPNVVEVVYSNGRDSYYAKVVNDDKNSPTSTVRRGREIIYRVTDPGFSGIPTDKQIQLYAKELLRQLSSVEYTISYSHGYCPVRLDDCVRLNYERAGLKNIKAKVIYQSIKCEAGCQVSEKAVYTKKLWEG